jgi:hypothetical protein
MSTQAENAENAASKKAAAFTLDPWWSSRERRKPAGPYELVESGVLVYLTGQDPRRIPHRRECCLPGLGGRANARISVSDEMCPDPMRPASPVKDDADFGAAVARFQQFLKANNFSERIVWVMPASAAKRGLAWSRSTLLHQRSGALAKLLKRDFQRTKFLRAQFR